MVFLSHSESLCEFLFVWHSLTGGSSSISIFSNSMNTELMFSSKSNEWSTPQSYFDSVRLEFWEFDLDPAADETNHKAARFFTIADDWLSQSWFWKVWCNPPYGRDLRKWVKKCFDESRGGGGVHIDMPTHSSQDRYQLLSRFHIQQTRRRDSLYSWASQVWRFKERGTVSFYACNFQIIYV